MKHVNYREREEEHKLGKAEGSDRRENTNCGKTRITYTCEPMLLLNLLFL